MSCGKEHEKTRYVLYDPDAPNCVDREYTYEERVDVIPGPLRLIDPKAKSNATAGYAFCNTDNACSYLQKQRNYTLVRNISDRERIFREVLGIGKEITVRDDPAKKDYTDATEVVTRQSRTRDELIESARKLGFVNPDYADTTELENFIKSAVLVKEDDNKTEEDDNKPDNVIPIRRKRGRKPKKKDE